MTEVEEETDLCILCNSPPPSPGTGFDSSKRSDSNLFSGSEEADLVPQLRVVFLLQQIFKYPLYDESMFKVMRSLGDPAGWFQICTRCSDLVDHGMNVFRKLKMVEAQYLEIRKKLERKVSLSKIGHVEDDGMMGRNELTDKSRIRLNFRSKLRGGIQVEMDCEIKPEPVADLAPDVEDHWAPCDDDLDDDTSARPSDNDSSSSWEAKPLRRKRAKLVTQRSNAQKAEMTNRPRLRGRPKKEVTEKPKQTRRSTRTRKRPDNMFKDDLPPESDSDDDHKDCIKKMNNQPRKRSSTRVKKENRSKPPATKKEFIPSSFEQAEQEKEQNDDDPDFPLIDDGEDKDYRHRPKKRTETADQQGSKQPKLEKNLFLAIVYECLDMSLIEYPPQTEEDKAKIPKLLKEDYSKVKAFEEGRGKYGAHPCPSCNNAFSTRFHAIAHIHRFHLGIGKPWRCNQCKYRASTTIVLRRHLLRHQKGALNICTICNFSFKSKRNFDVHFINHQKGIANPACSKCNLSFESFRNYVGHVVKEHGFDIPKRLVCEFCSKRFKTPRALEFHKLQCHNEPTSTKFPECSECNKLFLSDSNLKIHMDYHHPAEGSPAFFCEHCGKDFKNLDLLNSHRESWHVEEPEPCPLCGIEQRNARILRRHTVKNHRETLEMSLEERDEYAKKKREELAFQCTLCPEKFAFRVQLYHHYRSCHEEVTNKFKCDICGKGFSRQSSVKRHHEADHMKMKIKCEDCGKALPKDSLWQHRRYWCPVKKQREQEGPPPVPETQFSAELKLEGPPVQGQMPGPSLEMEYKELFQPPVVSNISYQDNGTAGSTHVLEVSRLAP